MTGPSALPHYATRLIGRAQSTGALVDLLLRPDTRLVTMIGASGTGKTRLALQVAETLAAHFCDGQYFVALASVANPRFVLPAIAQALDVREGGRLGLQANIAERLADRQILLILDNFEQVLAAAATVESLLEQASGLKILITSQVALGSASECVFEVPPLAYPESAEDADPERLLEYSAIALFVDRIQTVQPHFRLTAEHVQPIIEICRLVQGLPLAIELIAAHSALLAPADLLVFVRNHLALGGHSRKDTGRQRTLYPVLDWCYSRLNSAQQTLFGRLGMFVGGCTRAALAAIYEQRHDAGATLARDLATLQDKHLVLEETLAGQEPHLIMLDTIREYAHQRLHKRKEYALVAQAHTDYYLRWSALAEDGAQGDEQSRWSERFLSEIHNLRSALQRTIEQRQGAAAIELAARTSIHWYRLGYPLEGRDWLEQALALSEGVAPATLAAGLYSLGRLSFALGDYAVARDHLEQAAAIQRRHAPDDLASTLGLLGLMATYQGRYDEAEQSYAESLALARANNQTYKIMASLANLGFALINQGEADRAEAAINEARAIAAASGDQFGLALTAKNLGEIALLRGHHSEARRYAEDSLAQFRQLNVRGTVSFALNLLALIMVEAGALERARELALESAALHQEIGNTQSLAEALESGPLLLEAAGQPALAARLFGYIREQRQAGGVAQTAYVRQRYAGLEQRLGPHLDGARTSLSAAGAIELLSSLSL